MVKKSLYKKLVRKFKFTINNSQALNSECDFTNIKKNILDHKKDKRYYTDIQQFLSYLKKFEDKNELNFISNKSREKYKRSLENLESLLITTLLEKETGLSDIAVKKSNLKSLVMQPFLSMLFFLQLFTKQIITARPLEASRKTRSTNNCVIKGPHSEYNDNLDMKVYQNDLKSADFSNLFKYKQSIEFRFKDTIFILSENCLSRQSLDKKPQTLCQSDYTWFLSSMTIYFLGNKVRAEALLQGLSRQNDAAFAKIIQEICLINSNQQDARQLMGMDPLENFYGLKLENFIFNSTYVRDTYLSTFHGGNSSNLVSRINLAVKEKIKDLKLESEKSNVTSLNRDNYSRPLPETQSAISGVLQTDINTPSSISHRSAEGFNWMIIVPVAVGGIGFIVFLGAIIFWLTKKNRLENSGLATEGIPLLKSISDNLNILEIAGRLTQRLNSLEHLERYVSEIGNHYISFTDANNEKKAIEDLKKIQEALTKYLESKKSSNKDKIISNKLKSALLIVDSLIQRYNLLSLPNAKENKHNYLTDYLISGLKSLINSMILGTKIIRDNYKEPDKLDRLVDCERAAYDANLIAHADGYFEKNPPEQVINCLQLETNSNIKDNHKSELIKIEQIQANLLSSLKIIIDSFGELKDEFLILGKIKLSNVANSIIMQSVSLKSQLSFYFTDGNARKDEASKLKQTQAQAQAQSQAQAQELIENGFFVQPKSPKITKLSRKCTM